MYAVDLAPRLALEKSNNSCSCTTYIELQCSSIENKPFTVGNFALVDKAVAHLVDDIASIRVGVEITRGHDGLKSAVLEQAELVVLRYLG